MDKKQLLNKLNKSWSAFRESYAGLSDDQLLEPGVMGDWTVKDIIAHISVWEQESLTHLPHILEGESTPRYADLYGGIDAFNALKIEKMNKLTLSEVHHNLEETHLNLLDYLQSVPEEQFSSESRFRRRLRLDTYSHYPIHTRAILEWRELSEYRPG
jgi:hypothetical protein